MAVSHNLLPSVLVHPVGVLREFYARDRAALPGTLAGQRLPAAG